MYLQERVLALAMLFTIVVAPRVAGQTTEPDQTAPEDSGIPSQAPAASSTSRPAPSPDRPVSWKLLLPNMIQDQERIWSFPARAKQYWIPTAAALGITAGLISLDPAEGGYFRRTSTFHSWNNIFTGNATSFGIIAAPVSLYSIGLLRKDAKMQHTMLFAGEALADAEILTTVLKDATRRVRPADLPSRANSSDTWFESSGSYLRGRGSFPSGHTIAAFSIATVVSRHYADHRWVPYAAYGMAALVGFSRLTLSAHFLSDVFMGGALGYSISRFAVLRK